MLSNSMDGSFGLGQTSCRAKGLAGAILLAFGLQMMMPTNAQAGGGCTTDADCNLATNFCRPGDCNLFNQCVYNHTDVGCRGQRVCAGGARMGQACTSNANCPSSTCLPPTGDTLFCNGDNFCNETTQACAVNPVNCQPPTPQCDENQDECVECLNNTHCTTAPRLTCDSSGLCVECTASFQCNDGLPCNGTETCDISGLCQDGTPVTCTIKRCSSGSNIGGTCTGNAQCPGGGICELETCSDVFGACVQCDLDDECDDGQYCNGQETCNKQGRCAAGTPPSCLRCNGGTFGVCEVNGDCQGGTTCTEVGYCDETHNGCVQCLNDSHCPPDLTFCTDQACVFNSCTQISDPVAICGDGQFCNGPEVCLNNQANSTCTNCMIAHPNTCSGGSRNGLTCTMSSNCPGGTCVSHEVDCKGLVCNSFSSSPPYKACTTNADCPAGVQCVPGCCGTGTPVQCEDGVSCTMNKCSETTDSCTTTFPTKTCNNPARTLCDTNTDCPSGFTCTGLAFCDDGFFCNGQEVCGASGCSNPTPKVCTNVADEIACTSDADCKFCTTGANEGDPCEVGADCPGGLCAGTSCQVNCRSLTTQCTRGDCNENSNQCVGTPIRINEACDDTSPCTINEICNSSGNCVPNPSLPSSDAYRCVKLEWRNVTPATLFPGQTLTADLYAVADGCSGNSGETCPAGHADIVGLRALIKWNHSQLSLDPPAGTNPSDTCDGESSSCYRCQTCNGGSNAGAECISRCSAGPRYGFACLTNNECSQVCVGGTQNGMPCSGGCPGGSCGAAATCSSTVNTCRGGPNDGLPCTIPANCPSTSGQPPATCSNQFTCLGGGTCSALPATTQYDWFVSAFLNDCEADGINGPCPSSGFPGNDGSALYTTLDQFLPCAPSNDSFAACVSPSGMLVSRFRFRALRGGTSTLAFDPCLGATSKTSVTSAVTPPAPLTSPDVLKSLTPSVNITVKCNTTADCNDQNVCTNEVCDTNSGSPTFQTCIFTNNNGASCNDGLFCTLTDTCSNGVCSGSGVRCTGNGQCVGGSNPGAACTSHAGCTNGWCTAMTICDETNDRCAQCTVGTNCRDNVVCTQDVCSSAGLCQNPQFPCNDGLSCTTDTCIVLPPLPGTPGCQFTANPAACNSGQFCAAQLCDPLADPNLTPTGCVFAHSCVSTDGSPCPNDDCVEAGDHCGGCFAPAVLATGARYIRVTPSAAQGSTPIAILVEGDCDEPSAGCVSKYLSPRCVGGPNDGQSCVTDADCPKRCSGATSGTCVTDAECGINVCLGTCDLGFLADSPVYKPASSWGPVQVHGTEIRPDVLYRVHAQCNFGATTTQSAGTHVRPHKWGDAHGNSVVDAADISSVVNGFRNVYIDATYQSVNMIGTQCADPQAGCIGQACINFGDVSAVVDAFRGTFYPCPAVCP